MSRTVKGAKVSWAEYESRRFKSGVTPSKYAKKLTHRYERKRAVAEIESMLEGRR